MSLNFSQDCTMNLHVFLLLYFYSSPSTHKTVSKYCSRYCELSFYMLSELFYQKMPSVNSLQKFKQVIHQKYSIEKFHTKILKNNTTCFIFKLLKAHVDSRFTVICYVICSVICYLLLRDFA